MRHIKKIQVQFFNRIAEGIKPFEIRLNDCFYQCGDEIELHEVNFLGLKTGRFITATIGFVSDYAQKDGFVVFGLLNISVVQKIQILEEVA